MVDILEGVSVTATVFLEYGDKSRLHAIYRFTLGQ